MTWRHRAGTSALLTGVSQKMLTQTLRSLERDGLITRTATPAVPVTVSYELTDLGLSLHQIMRGSGASDIVRAAHQAVAGE
jgi:DNA-binding HxlR family transcriptional regulator